MQQEAEVKQSDLEDLKQMLEDKIYEDIKEIFFKLEKIVYIP